MKTWITADWHLGEDRLELMGRPFTSANEHVYAIQERYNAVVAPEDEVFMVGDVVYQKASPEWLTHVANFNGRKTLFRGNHDRGFTDDQLKPYFDTIIPEGQGIEREFCGIPCYITHYPTEGKRELFNLVGHIHSAWKYQLNMLNIGVDVHHFSPVDSDRIRFHFDAIAKFYDADVWVAYSALNEPYRCLRGKKNTYFRPDTVCD